MKTGFPATLLVAVVLAAGCDAAPATTPVPAAPPTPTIVVTVEQTPATTTITLPPTSAPVTTSAPPRTATKAPVRKATPTRKAPQYGYQCRDGDEAEYEVCAGHKAWVDGQLEFTGCLDGGGTWDTDTQRCVRP